jgi:hypothetical protein
MKRSSGKGVDTSKRCFFRSFVAETFSLVDETRGRPQMSIGDLDKVPDQIFEEIVPVRHNDSGYSIDGDRLLRLDRKSKQQELCHTFDPTEMSILHRFDGAHTIGQLADGLSADTGADRQECYRRVRLLFILLAKRMVFLPSSAHDR